MDEFGEAVTTIGVRLALEDGVSAGMAALQAEIGAMARLLAGTPGLGVAAALAAPPAAPPRGIPPVAPGQAGGAEIVPAVASVVPVPVAPPVVGATERVVERYVVERMSAAEAPAPVRVPTRSAVAPAVAPIGVGADIEVHPVLAAREAKETASSMPASVVLPLERSAAPVGGQAGLSAPAASAAATAEVPGGEPAPSPSAALDWAQAVAPQLPQVAPVAMAGGERAGGGPVYLDGRLLGHWLAEHLAQEAGRPMAGGVGFDGRMGPAWPGALQGG